MLRGDKWRLELLEPWHGLGLWVLQQRYCLAISNWCACGGDGELVQSSPCLISHWLEGRLNYKRKSWLVQLCIPNQCDGWEHGHLAGHWTVRWCWVANQVDGGAGEVQVPLWTHNQRHLLRPRNADHSWRYLAASCPVHKQQGHILSLFQQLNLDKVEWFLGLGRAAGVWFRLGHRVQ